MRAPDRIVRHGLPDRIFHWVMAASVLALLATGFLPILGVRFSWVTMHWIAGLVLGAAVLFHMARAVIWLEPSAMMVWPADLRDAWRATLRALGRRTVVPKPGKYLLLQKLYHHAIALVLLTTLGTGLMMMVKVDTPFWTRDPYWLSDATWGVIYVLHGLADDACRRLAVLVESAPPGFAGWTIPVEPAFATLRGREDFQVMLRLLAERAR